MVQNPRREVIEGVSVRWRKHVHKKAYSDKARRSLIDDLMERYSLHGDVRHYIKELFITYEMQQNAKTAEQIEDYIAKIKASRDKLQEKLKKALDRCYDDEPLDLEESAKTITTAIDRAIIEAIRDRPAPQK